MIDLDFIERLIQVFDDSGVDSLEIERGGTRVKLSKTPPTAATPILLPTEAPVPPAAPPPGPSPAAEAPRAPERGPAPSARELLETRIQMFWTVLAVIDPG